MNVFKEKALKLQFSRRQQLAFLEDLYMLLQDGVPINQGVQAMCAVATDVVAHVAKDIAQSIARGVGISEGMEPWFTVTVVNLIRAGAMGGALEPALRSAIDVLQQQQSSLSAWAAALSYPLVVLGMALGMVVFIQRTVLQSFIQIKPLSQWPSVGKNLMNFGFWLGHWWWFLLIFLIGVLCAVTVLLYGFTGAWRTKLDQLPGFRLYRGAVAAHFMESLGLLLKNGVMIRQAFTLLQRQARPYLLWHVAHMELRLSEGFEDMAQVIDTQLISKHDLYRLKVVVRGKGIDHALISLGRQSYKLQIKRMAVYARCLGGLLLVGATGMMAWVILAIYAVSTVMGS